MAADIKLGLSGIVKGKKNPNLSSKDLIIGSIDEENSKLAV